MPKNETAENHRRYLERTAFYKSFGYDVKEERKFIFEKSKPISGKILEVGTGKGHFTLELAKSGYSFTSIDVSQEEQDFAKLNIEHAGLKKRVDFKIENAEHLSFENACFDVVFSINTIHHLKNPFKVMDGLIRILCAQGKIILSDFSKEGFRIINQIHESEGRKHESSHTKLRDIKDYFNSKRLLIKEYESICQKILIGYRK